MESPRIDVAALERLDESATPAPWFSGDCDDAGSVTTGDGDRVCSDDNILVSVQEDFDLIAAMRNALPSLLRLVREAAYAARTGDVLALRAALEPFDVEEGDDDGC